MIPTPRTDANVAKHGLTQLSGNAMVYAAFAQQLERELAAMTAERDALKAKLATIHKELGCELRDPNGTIWEHAAKVEKERDALLAKNQWHPVSEPPNDDRDVWTSDGQGYYDPRDKQWWGNGGYGRLTSIFVTHWRELPKPPKEGE